MTQWLDDLFNKPINENPWALGLLILMAAAFVGPLLMELRREMFRWRRKQETTMTDENQGPLTPEPTALKTDGPVFAQSASTPGWVGLDTSTDDGIDPQAAAREAAMQNEDGERVQQLPSVGIFTEPAQVDAETEARWKAQGIDTEQMATPTGLSVDYIGTAPIPQPLISQQRIDCAHCHGRGFVPGINDLLNESLALLGDNGDEVIRAFYSRLFMVAPDLRAIFPGDPTQGDLGTDHKGARQRELLLNAIAALAKLYDPGDSDKMVHLDNALEKFGRDHAAFDRGNGTTKGATLEEYFAVKDALFTTLVRTAAEAWRAEYTEAWSQAYDYAAAVMIAAQLRSGFSAPRFPRQG